jgi:branched-chain amino acid transport system substrate-binding protein
MRFREGMAALAGAAFVLSAPMALAQVKTTNQGITDTEIAVGTHQDLSGPIKTWGVSVANGM